MSRTNLAYKQQPQRRGYQADPIPLPRPKFRTIEGQGKGSAAKPRQAPWVQTLVIMSVVVAMMLATIAIARVSISNATVQMMQTSEQTRAAINSARQVGMELEVVFSLGNNPTRIQDAAATMGVLPSHSISTVAARGGFTVETIYQMSLAADEARALELQALYDRAELAAAEKPAVVESVLTPSPTQGLLQTAGSGV
ncbi:MAG: hypothetical protein FWE41_07125 [Coriobacteriia bacterium]|nr:hypothetical protein [Coriobacteriia bacterium]MCL2750258.1 hypothetical protein [Coriobacteriia bacterium]